MLIEQLNQPLQMAVKMNKKLIHSFYKTTTFIACALIGALGGYLLFGFLGMALAGALGLFSGFFLRGIIISDLV